MGRQASRRSLPSDEHHGARPPKDGHVHEQADISSDGDEEPQPLGHEAPEIVEDATRIGERRLERPAIGDAITAFIGGMSICFGVIAMAWAGASLGGTASPSPAHLVGSLAYPIGFVILLVGKSELFTENFLLPVTGVLEGHGQFGQLLGLWGRSLALNLLGAFVFAALISRPGVLPDAVAIEIQTLGEHVLDDTFGAAFVKAIFAGWLMTILTWLLLAAEGVGPRLFIIWVIGTLIVLGEFAHIIISGGEVFMSLFLEGDVAIDRWLTGTFFPILFGNVLGGTIFVTLLHYVQARFSGNPVVDD